MAKSIVSMTLDPDVHQEFKRLVEEVMESSVSAEVNKYMKETIKQFNEEKKR